MRMTDAVRRQIRDSGWRILGALIGLALLAAGLLVWGNHIEHRIDGAQKVGVSDHRALTRLATAVGERQALHPPRSPESATHTGTVPSGGGDAVHQPSHQGHQHPSPQDGGSQHGNGGPQSPPPQAEPSNPNPSPPSTAGPPQPGQSSSAPPAETPAAEPQPEHPVREAAGTVVEEVGETANGVVCGITGALNLSC